MKKLMLLASLLVVLSVSAQERTQREKPQKEHSQKNRPTVDDELKRFDGYNLSSSQKKKVRNLLEDRQKNFSKNGEPNGHNNHGQQNNNGDHRPDMNNGKGPKNDDFDTKLEKVLNKKQFSQYKQDREKGPKHNHKENK